MINSIRGDFTGRSKSSLFLQGGGGIEWNIECSEGTILYAAAKKNDVKIYIHLHHKEDSMKLFGFQNERERLIFLELIKVSGIGPKQGMRMLSGIGSDELLKALDSGDTDRLSLVPGIGKKTAAKIILSLRGKLTLDLDKSDQEMYPEILEALTNMGFDKRKAKNALKELGKKKEFKSLSKDELEKQLFREAIVFLSS